MSKKKHEFISQMTEIESRWFNFLAKLEERMQELCEASIPDLTEMYYNDQDEYKRAFGNFLSGIQGQLNSILEKAEKIEEEKVSDPLDEIEDELDEFDDDKLKEFFEDLQERCEKRFEQFENKVEYWENRILSANAVDYEKVYQDILDEYETIKDKFACKQCGSPVVIEKIFFTPAFIQCPACQTQNTFIPSSRTAQMDYVGRMLAEQRTVHLLKAHEDEEERERELYDKIHKLEIEKIGHEIDGNKDKIKELNAQIAVIEKERKDCISNAPELYKKYLTAKFEEWIRLVPGLEEQNRKVYEQWLNDYTNKKRVIL